MRIALAGAGAFGEKHLDGLKLIDGVEIVSIVSRRLEQAEAVAQKVAKQLEVEVAAAEKKADAEIAEVETKEKAQAMVRQETIKSIQEKNASILEKSMQQTQSLREQAK